MGSFNRDSFMGHETDQQGSVVSTPVPAGEYIGAVKDADAEEIATKKGDRTIIRVVWSLDSSDEVDIVEAKQETGRDELTVRQDIFCDVDGNNRLDWGKGKNVQLGRLRDALGQNQAGQAWNPSKLKGAGPARILVSHRAGQNEGEVYAEVKRVAAV